MTQVPAFGSFRRMPVEQLEQPTSFTDGLKKRIDHEFNLATDGTNGRMVVRITSTGDCVLS